MSPKLYVQSLIPSHLLAKPRKLFLTDGDHGFCSTFEREVAIIKKDGVLCLLQGGYLSVTVHVVALCHIGFDVFERKLRVLRAL